MNESEFDRTARAWLEDGPTRMSDRAVLSTLEEIHTTRQRRSWWPAWRSDQMNTYAKLIAGAAALLLVAVVGYQFLPGKGGVGGGSTTSLASGTFKAKGAEVKLDATGAGDSVTGTMAVTDEDMAFTVDLECTLTAADGRILIGGDTTESTFDFAPEGTRTAIVLKPGSPVHAAFVFQSSDLARAPSCLAFLEDMSGAAVGPGALEPIEGSVTLGP